MSKFVESQYTVNIELRPEQFHKNFINELKMNLKRDYEDKCSPKFGFIKRNSTKIIKKSPGEIIGSGFNAHVTYKVTFSCLATKPFKGGKLICSVVKKNNSGLLCIVRSNQDSLPYLVLIPLHLDEENRELIESVVVNKTIIEVEIIDYTLIPSSRRQRKSQYLVIGKILASEYAVNEKIMVLDSVEKPESLLLTAKTFTSEPADWVERTTYIGKSRYAELEAIKDEITAKKDILLKAGTGPARPIWDSIKKLINHYELITNSFPHFKTVSGLNDCIISRAFYKMHEILNEKEQDAETGIYSSMFNILKQGSMRVLNLAESPGGFVQSIIYSRNYAEKTHKDEYVVISIPEGKAPLWERFEKSAKTWRDKGESMGAFQHDVNVMRVDNKYLNSDEPVEGTPTVKLVSGNNEEGKMLGDITNVSNIEYLLNNLEFSKKRADLVTADGGFDSKEDYNKQEIHHYRLFLSEITIALASQAEGGTFVLKIYDILTQFTVEMLSLLTMFYSTVRIFKPFTSRQANSEKYVVCTGFVSDGRDKIVGQLMKILREWDESAIYGGIFAHDLDMDTTFIEGIKRYNLNYLDVQIDNIASGINRLNEILAEAETKRQTVETVFTDHVKAVKMVQEKKTTELLEDIGLPVKK